MNSSWLRCLFLSMSALGMFSALSCGSKQQLVSINVTPQGSKMALSGVGQHLSTQFTAVGSYIHPPATKDITSFAVWKTDAPGIITLSPSQPGLVTTTGFACGTNLGVTANVYSNPSNPAAGSVISGQATVDVSIPECTP